MIDENVDELLRLVNRQRPQRDFVNQREHGGVGTHAQGQSPGGQHRESRRAVQGAPCVTNVLHAAAVEVACPLSERSDDEVEQRPRPELAA